IDTREAQRDAHLRSADFFDAENHPNMTFRTRRIERTGDDEYRVTGDPTIRGVTREVVLDARFEGRAKKPTGEEVIGLTASTSVGQDDGVKWNRAVEAGGWLVGKEGRIALDVQASRQDGGFPEDAEGQRRVRGGPLGSRGERGELHLTQRRGAAEGWGFRFCG